MVTTKYRKGIKVSSAYPGKVRREKELQRKIDFIQEKRKEHKYPYPEQFEDKINNAITKRNPKRLNEIYTNIEKINYIVDKLDAIEFPDEIKESIEDKIITTKTRQINILFEYIDKMVYIQNKLNIRHGDKKTDPVWIAKLEMAFSGDFRISDQEIIDRAYKGKDKIEFYEAESK